MSGFLAGPNPDILQTSELCLSLFEEGLDLLIVKPGEHAMLFVLADFRSRIVWILFEECLDCCPAS